MLTDDDLFDLIKYSMDMEYIYGLCKHLMRYIEINKDKSWDRRTRETTRDMINYLKPTILNLLHPNNISIDDVIEWQYGLELFLQH